MRDEARRVLVQLVKEFGPGVADHPDRFRGLFLDFAPWQIRAECMPLIQALSRAAQLGLVARLTAYRPPAPGQTAGTPQVFLRLLTLEFEELNPSNQAEARWACEAWAVALGVIDEPPPEPIVMIAHDPLPVGTTPPAPVAQVPLAISVGSSSPPVSLPPRARPPARPIPQPPSPPPAPPPKPAPPPSPPIPAIAPLPAGPLDWITPSLIDTVAGCALAAGLITGLDSVFFLFMRLYPMWESWGAFASPWAVVIVWAWDQGRSRARFTNADRHEIVWNIYGVVLLAACHYWLWNVFTTNYPGYQPVWLWAFHMAIGVPGIALLKYHTHANKLAEYMFVTLGAVLVGMSFLDAGIAVAYHCPMWAMFLAITWWWPFRGLFQRVQEPTSSIVTLWFVGWLLAFFVGQWALLNLVGQYIPGWEIWVLIALHLFVGWTMVWMVHPNMRSMRVIIASVVLLVLTPICVMFLGHALFQPS